ncbi:M28 family peptidase [Conexibacter sp. SYSU D00693]|uniref:M28 family peptidase n=1 Tax=Conexibacter sp. SYSU D00693 TaxID=2812560 RepID=UPI00196B8003|nr:M28 family peptidase [Conexibacter sp. SYSU D00693]
MSEGQLREVVEHLASIERGSASPGEHEAAAWIADRLRALGLRVEVEDEPAHGGFWWPIGLLNAATLVGAASSRPWRRRLLAAGALALLVDDLDHRSRAFRRLLPRRRARNVTAYAGDPDAPRTVVVVAHHDAAHGGAIFDTTLLEAVFERWPAVVQRAKRWPPVMWGVVLGPILTLLGKRRAGAAASLGAIGVMVDIGRSPVVPGANDNLSAVAVLLALAERRLEGIRVILVSTGAEESNSEGMQGWGRRHFPELDKATTTFIALETLGSGHLVIAESEGFLVQHAYTDRVKDLANRVADAKGIEVWRGLRNAFASDGQIPLHAGYPSMLLGGLDDMKLPANYHKPTDVPERLDLACMAQAVDLLEGVVAALADEA